MYDEFKGRGAYNRFRDMTADFINGDSSREAEEILQMIEDSYENGELSASQYDHLLRIMEDYED